MRDVLLVRLPQPEAGPARHPERRRAGRPVRPRSDPAPAARASRATSGCRSWPRCSSSSGSTTSWASSRSCTSRRCRSTAIPVALARDGVAYLHGPRHQGTRAAFGYFRNMAVPVGRAVVDPAAAGADRVVLEHHRPAVHAVGPAVREHAGRARAAAGLLAGHLVPADASPSARCTRPPRSRW